MFGDDVALRALQILAKQELGQTDAARAIAVDAAARFPDRVSFQFDARLLLPAVYADKADLDTRRAQFAAGLGEIEAMLPALQRDASSIYTLERSNFLLAYQDEDDLPLQRRYANIIGSMIAAADPALRE